MIIKEVLKSKNLDRKIIRNITKDELKDTLLKVLYNNFTLLRLWRFKDLFLRLDEEAYIGNPALISGLIMIYMMQGNLKKAQELKELLPKDSIYLQYINIVDPSTTYAEFKKLIKRQKELNIPPDPNFSLTAGRPSIINGFRDMTGYVKDFKKDKEVVMDTLKTLYGEGVEQIYNIALAEKLYQANECYEALILTVSTLPILEEKKDVRILFVALYLEVMILVMNGQVKNIAPLMENLKAKTKTHGMEEWLLNIRALEAWAAMYDGDYKKIVEWMDSYAPDEYQDFNMMDLFRYMVKIRGYLITQKYLSISSLATRLLPLLREGNRKMDECELLMLLALSDYAREDYDEAFKHIEESLKIAQEYRYNRLLADEGEKMYRLLSHYRKEKGKDPYLNYIISLTQKVLVLYPNYLKDQLPVAPSLTNGELGVLRLINDGRSNSEICELLSISLNTVKFYTKNIFKKLDVNNRQQAVKVAKEYGLI